MYHLSGSDVIFKFQGFTLHVKTPQLLHSCMWSVYIWWKDMYICIKHYKSEWLYAAGVWCLSRRSGNNAEKSIVFSIKYIEIHLFKFVNLTYHEYCWNFKMKR